MPNFIEIGGVTRKFSKKLVDLTRNDPCVEVGCRGYVSESNKTRITTILKSLDIKPSKGRVTELTLSIFKIELLTSILKFFLSESVAVSKLQIVILARSYREMSQPVRID